MKQLLLIALLMTAAPPSVKADPPVLTVPSEVAGVSNSFIMVPATTTAKNVQWLALDPGLNLFPTQLLKDSKTAVVTAGQKGRYRILAYTAVGDEPSAPAVATVVIDAAPPTPPGPTPPGPTPPGPTPPGPTPPIPVAGFRVLVVYETSQLNSMPKDQLDILYSQSVRNLLNSKCVVGADGHTKDWRMWDADVKTTNENPLWQDAMRRPRASLPFLLISDGKTGYEGPLPKNVEEFTALINKYAGS